jgi:hypothetical protein
MKAGSGNTLVLSGKDGAADLCGIAKETSPEAEATLAALFVATADKPSDPKTLFPALDLEVGDCRADFRWFQLSPVHCICIVSRFCLASPHACVGWCYACIRVLIGAYPPTG